MSVRNKGVMMEITSRVLKIVHSVARKLLMESGSPESAVFCHRKNTGVDRSQQRDELTRNQWSGIVRSASSTAPYLVLREAVQDAAERSRVEEGHGCSNDSSEQ